jgi:hypothetical protein
MNEFGSTTFFFRWRSEVPISGAGSVDLMKNKTQAMETLGLSGAESSIGVEPR